VPTITDASFAAVATLLAVALVVVKKPSSTEMVIPVVVVCPGAVSCAVGVNTSASISLVTAAGEPAVSVTEQVPGPVLVNPAPLRVSSPLDTIPYFYHCGIMEKDDAIAALAALAQGSRLDVFRLLVQAGVEGMPAGQIGDRLGLPSATLSFHLNQLRHAGLVTFRREGRSLIYAAEYITMNGLLAYLTENCCQGDPSACNLGICDSSSLVTRNKGSLR
jgi:ArsR family transcriptional regulator